jgi:hypothetical protein
MGQNNAPGLDPGIWGPPLWNLIFDLCWSLEIQKCTMKQKRDVKLFFQCLTQVLPCKYCRESYIVYYRKLGDVPCGQGALQWAYRLKNMVNQKLKIPKPMMPSYEKIEKRMQVYSSKSSTKDIFDFLFLVSINYVSFEKHKSAALYIFMSTLPNVIASISTTEHQNLSNILKENPISLKDLQTQKQFQQYLCSIGNKMDHGRRNPDMMHKKYCKCISKKSK